MAAVNKDKWVPDDNAPNCFGCRSDFNMIRRRHHCRLCGSVFCGNCSKNELYVIPNYVRVCDGCYHKQKEISHQKALEQAEREKTHFKELQEEEARERAKAKAKKAKEDGGGKGEKKDEGGSRPSLPEESGSKGETSKPPAAVSPPSQPSSSHAPHRPAPSLPAPHPPASLAPGSSGAAPHRPAPPLPHEPVVVTLTPTVISTPSAPSSSTAPHRPAPSLPTEASQPEPHLVVPPHPITMLQAQLRPLAPSSSAGLKTNNNRAKSPVERSNDGAVPPSVPSSSRATSPPPPSVKPKPASSRNPSPKPAAVSLTAPAPDSSRSSSPSPAPKLVSSSSAPRLKPVGGVALPKGPSSAKPSSTLSHTSAAPPEPEFLNAPPVPSRKGRTVREASPSPHAPAAPPSSSTSSHDAAPPVPSRSSRPGMSGAPPPRP